MIESLKREFQKPLVRYGGIAVVILLVVQELILPWFDWRAATVAQLQASADVSVSTVLVEGALADLGVKKQKLETTREVLSNRFAPKTGNESIELPSEFKGLIDRWSLASTRVAVSEIESTTPPLIEFAISLELEGRPSDIFGMVASIEKQSKLSRVDRVTLYDIKPKRVKARMEIRRYVVPN
jgi:hypothetical protein